MNEPLIEGALVALALGLLVGYHLLLWWRVRRRPLETAFGLARHTRSRWGALVMAELRDNLGVQTLRNWTMAATFLASIAMLIALALRYFNHAGFAVALPAGKDEHVKPA